MFTPKTLSYEELRKEAAAFLERYHATGEPPVPIEEIVEFDLNMQLIPMEGLKSEIGVEAFLANDLASIYIDEYVLQFATSRARFSLAHEVAHWWLHSPLYRSQRISSVPEWKALVESIDPTAYQWFEWQANSLAGLILVPCEPLATLFRAKVAEAARLGVPRRQLESYPARAALIRFLAGQFAVSELVVEIRLEKDGLLTPHRQ